jgi:hypothetical protein
MLMFVSPKKYLCIIIKFTIISIIYSIGFLLLEFIQTHIFKSFNSCYFLFLLILLYLWEDLL